MSKNNRNCPECEEPILKDDVYFVAPDEDGDYGAVGEYFRFHPSCWSQGGCLGQLKEHTLWLIGLAAITLNWLRTQYSPVEVPEYAADYMPELDEAVVGLIAECNMLREVSRKFRDTRQLLLPFPEQSNIRDGD
jgi:hypothetical protein